MFAIFNNYWLNQNYPGIGNGIASGVPVGGWGNWSFIWNIDSIIQRIQANEAVVLIGPNGDDLLRQASNAGERSTTKCTLGIEVLLLLSFGYTFDIPISVDVGNYLDFKGINRVHHIATMRPGDRTNDLLANQLGQIRDRFITIEVLGHLRWWFETGFNDDYTMKGKYIGFLRSVLSI